MSFSMPANDLVTGYLTGGEHDFDREYLLERSLEFAHSAAMMPEVYTFETPGGYQDYLDGEGSTEFENLGRFEEWLEEADQDGKSIVMEFYPAGDHESRVIIAYEEREHVKGVTDWIPSIPEEFSSKIEINAQGDKYRSARKIVDRHFPEIGRELEMRYVP